VGLENHDQQGVFVNIGDEHLEFSPCW